MNKLSFAPVSVSFNVEYKDKNAIMMVDPRDKDLYGILGSIEKQIDPSWDFYMFGSTANRNSIEKWFTNKKRKLYFYEIPKKFMLGNLNLKYSEFLEDPWIWKTIKAENILLVQTDAAICDHGKFDIAEFTKFPYIGAAYSKEEGQKCFWGDTYPNAYFYGVGGMSMRKRSFMLSCIEKNISGKGVPEDVFFSTCLGHTNKKDAQPTARDMHRFSVETNYSNEYGRPSFGVHKPGLQMSLEEMEALRTDCPAAWGVGLKERYLKLNKK